MTTTTACFGCPLMIFAILFAICTCAVISTRIYGKRFNTWNIGGRNWVPTKDCPRNIPPIARWKKTRNSHWRSIDPQMWSLQCRKQTMVSQPENPSKQPCKSCTCWWYSLCTFQYRQHYENTRTCRFEC